MMERSVVSIAEERPWQGCGVQAAEWAALIDQWRQSGLSLPAFCQRHGLSRGSMQNWVYKPELKRAVVKTPGAKPNGTSMSVPHPPASARVLAGQGRSGRRGG